MAALADGADHVVRAGVDLSSKDYARRYESRRRLYQWRGTETLVTLRPHGHSSRSQRGCAGHPLRVPRDSPLSSCGCPDGPQARGEHVAPVTAPGTPQGQVEETSSDLALSHQERATGIEPA